jgi:hypothetical protein
MIVYPDFAIPDFGPHVTISARKSRYRNTQILCRAPSPTGAHFLDQKMSVGVGRELQLQAEFQAEEINSGNLLKESKCLLFQREYLLKRRNVK